MKNGVGFFKDIFLFLYFILFLIFAPINNVMPIMNREAGELRVRWCS